MRHATGLLLLLTVLSVPALAADLPPLMAPFHVAFDGAATATPGAVSVTGADKLRYVEGKAGQAGDFESGQCVEYTNLPPLNLASGALELLVRPLHDPKEMEDHYYLQFLRQDGSAIMEVTFTHVEMSAQVTVRTGGRTFRRYGWGWPGNAWSHLVITWDSAGASPAGLGLYRDGIETGYPATYQAMEQPATIRIGCKSPATGPWAKAHLDELTIYNRWLSRLQVKALAAKAALPHIRKMEEMAGLVAADDGEAARRREQLFAARVGIIYGRSTSLLNWPDSLYQALDLPVPTAISEDDLAKTDLSQYKTLIVPGGGGLRLTDANKQALLKYVNDGGGYVGICGGATTANQYGLVDCTTYKFNVRGPVWVKLQPHPLTDGYDTSRMILFPHASGPLFVPKSEDQQTVLTFDVGDPPLPTFSHTVVRALGKGRVVVFSGHPEGSADTRPMLRNAVMWTARIIGDN
ncbi:LamG domain-containing protein [bacterium]|nr:LamG domain-containing protein [bacterium]